MDTRERPMKKIQATYKAKGASHGIPSINQAVKRECGC